MALSIGILKSVVLIYVLFCAICDAAIAHWTRRLSGSQLRKKG